MALVAPREYFVALVAFCSYEICVIFDDVASLLMLNLCHFCQHGTCGTYSILWPCGTQRYCGTQSILWHFAHVVHVAFCSCGNCGILLISHFSTGTCFIFAHGKLLIMRHLWLLYQFIFKIL